MTNQTGRKPYGFFEGCIHTLKAVRTAGAFKKATRSGALSREFAERLMLAVTQVNGCAMCSYAHTKMALEAGLSAQEIEHMLGGTVAGVPTDELPAVLFAQHYAEQRGKPSKEAWARIVALYGGELSLGILGAIRMIMVGNTYGMPLGSLMNRFRSKEGMKPDPRSNIFYELLMMIGFVISIPFVLLCAGIASLVSLPLIRFKNS